MRLFFSIFFFITFSTQAAYSNYNFEIDSIGLAKTKKMVLSDNSYYLLYENNLGWTDSLGNYGKSFCFGRIKVKKDIAIEFNLICEAIDQNGDKSWSEFTRSDTSMDAGAGRSTYIDGTGIYKYFIGSKCIFSTKYLDDTLFIKTKCKIDADTINRVRRN
ncbi:MAG: hypothetical protein CFH34_00993 [Alphaproteobacteria bacterium MarineAlpha9_Bin4]|nr:hypothetical protein [Pelagibacterales bacterium]PPR26358.1 MAG: hypothetical protein CFH34_00993 [Alphaproteobacteria bacterium MarineAlpha9_Bin4]|tara:strand:+ start:782 stop:1261 length:480 start_codon:yes stop_codon:yes gene_type:complete